MKTIYLIRHSAPFVDIDNYNDYKNVSWSEYNQNMILSSEGEEKAKKLCEIEEIKGLDAIYSASSSRSIGTAKYVAEMNNLKIKLDDRINERELGVNKISELPSNFSIESFNNKDLKYGFGESLNEVDARFESFIKDILVNDKVAIFTHEIIMMSYLENNTDFSFDGKIMRLLFNNKEIYNDKMRNPLVFRIDYEDNKIVSIKNIW